ncbi:MAG: transcriptional repressor LexA [Spirochaetaceae bacterium]|nr:transcriptional repressor LexA [Spirochaetaceae bacterium]
MKELTKRQEEVLTFIVDFINSSKYPPTMREIASNFHMTVNGAYDHVKALEKKGKIHCDVNRSRAIGIIKEKEDLEEIIEVPLLGNVAAGKPLLSEGNFDGFIKIPSSNLSHGTHFALIVRGDSMQDIGIMDGDTAIMVYKQTAENGDIIVAMVNDEAVTLKRFYKEKNRIKLKAENPVYPPIYSQNVRILGKLQYLIRSYE